jgi:Flp pilus assembly protein TadD
MFSLARFINENTHRRKDRNLALELVDAFDHFENGRLEEAAEGFGHILGADTEHPIAHLMFGRVLVEMKEYEFALKALQRHLELVPDCVEALIYMGLACYELERFDGAVEFFERAHELKKDSVMATENLAIAQMAINDLSDALDELLELHEEEPLDTEIIELIVLTLGKQGQWDAAKQWTQIMKQASGSTVDT